MSFRPTRVTVDLEAICHNARIAQRQAGTAALCAVVKADAYGHGAIAVAKALTRAGVGWLAVATVEEGIALRKAGITARILVLVGNFCRAWDAVVQHGLTPVLGAAEDVSAFSRAAGDATLDVHVEVDTGMARLGVMPTELAQFLAHVQRHKNLRIEGLMSHLAHADTPDAAQNVVQMGRLAEAEAVATRAGVPPHLQHILNSGGLLAELGGRRDIVRCGLVLFGVQPAVGRTYADLRPVLRWTTRPLMLRQIASGTPVSYGGRWRAKRQTLLATLPVGYADGYRRLLTNRAHVLIRGQTAPVVGAVCMDVCMVDVTDVADVHVDDEVVLLGAQGDAQITVDMLAAWADSFSYEILCTIGHRVPRNYTNAVPT